MAEFISRRRAVIRTEHFALVVIPAERSERRDPEPGVMVREKFCASH